MTLPDPDANPTPDPSHAIYMSTAAAYAGIETTVGELPELLKKQNQHRATLGLPPLPDLTTVTHDKLALGPSQQSQEATTQGQDR